LVCISLQRNGYRIKRCIFCLINEANTCLELPNACVDLCLLYFLRSYVKHQFQSLNRSSSGSGFTKMMRLLTSPALNTMFKKSDEELPIVCKMEDILHLWENIHRDREKTLEDNKFARFCYVVFNSHMFNATKFHLCKWGFHIKFYFSWGQYRCGAPERLRCSVLALS
jgi:hypothetical protein